MKKNTIHKGFTLIELIISIAIFGIIMVSVMSIFLFSSQMSTRVELNRIMQENIKNVMEDIAEDMRKGTVTGAIIVGSSCPTGIPDPINTSFTPKNRLCLKDQFGGDVEYMIGYKDLSSNKWLPVTNIADCASFVKSGGVSEDTNTICRVVKLEGGERFPLTNSFVAIEKLDFYVINDVLPKVMISMTVRPAARKGLASNLLKASTIQIQTTISERFIDMK